MFILDSLMISGIRWVLDTAITAAEAEMNDDSVLREQLLEAELRREMGEIDDGQFAEIEADLLARIRAIKERREGAGPLEFGGQPLGGADGAGFQVEASVSGDFHDPAAAPHTTVIDTSARGGEEIRLLDMEAGDASPPVEPLVEPAPKSTRRLRTRESQRRARPSPAARPKQARQGRATRTKR